jgi:hypothetical protein
MSGWAEPFDIFTRRLTFALPDTNKLLLINDEYKAEVAAIKFNNRTWASYTSRRPQLAQAEGPKLRNTAI